MPKLLLSTIVKSRLAENKNDGAGLEFYYWTSNMIKVEESNKIKAEKKNNMI